MAERSSYIILKCLNFIKRQNTLVYINVQNYITINVISMIRYTNNRSSKYIKIPAHAEINKSLIF